MDVTQQTFYDEQKGAVDLEKYLQDPQSLKDHPDQLLAEAIIKSIKLQDLPNNQQDYLDYQ